MRMKRFLTKTLIVLAMGAGLYVGQSKPAALADGSIPIPVSLIGAFDEAYAKVTNANNEIAKIKAEAGPSMDSIRAICEATLYQAGVKQKEIENYELDPTTKSLRLKKK